MDISDIERTLKNAPINYRTRDVAGLEVSLRRIKSEAVACNDQVMAKEAWCLEQVLESQTLYVGAFDNLKKAAYYAAWCELEKVEITLHHLAPHIGNRGSSFWTNSIAKHTKQFQSLFPYKVFFSPEMVYKKMVCTICRRQISIRRPCEHRVGEIYNGEMCGREITDIESGFGIALVTNPVQKYSVAFPNEGLHEPAKDTFEYGPVRYIIERLESPFDDWTCHWTKNRHPHARYKEVGRNAPCPCESGKKYKKCCLNESGVLRPHLDVEFEKTPKLPTPLEYF